LLEQAAQHGAVRIRRSDGQEFMLMPLSSSRSALDVTGIDLNISTQEVIDIVREGRERQSS
jgi:hypothetical protein